MLSIIERGLVGEISAVPALMDIILYVRALIVRVMILVMKALNLISQNFR